MGVTGRLPGEGARLVASPKGHAWPPRWRSTRTARGWGAPEGGSGVLHEGPGLVQYGQPLASATPPSCSTGRPGAGVSRNLEPALNHGLRAPAQEPQGGGPAGQGTADPRPGAPGPATTTPQSRSVPRLSVHGADINGPNRQRAQRESLECCGFSPAHIAGAGLMSALWTPTPHQTSSPRPHPRLLDHQPTPDSRPSEHLRSHDTHMS